MAIKPGYKQFTFDGENSGDYGVYITGSAVYNSPERDVELIEIPGRNGAFVLDNGRFENIEVTYPAGIYAESQEDFAQAISDLRNMLASRKGYCRLTDEYNPEEYRMAVYKSGLDVDPVAFQRAGEFSITFDCKPQRWLTSGEQAVTMTSGDTLTNPTLFESSPLLEVEGYGTIDFNGYEIELTNETYGEITLTDRWFSSIYEMHFETSQSFDRYTVETGDIITLVYSVNPYSLWSDIAFKLNNAYTYNGEDVTVQQTNLERGQWGTGGLVFKNEIHLYARLGPTTFTVGTASTVTGDLKVTFPVKSGNTVVETVVLETQIAWAYDGNDTISVIIDTTITGDTLNLWTLWGGLSFFNGPPATTNSTATYLGHPTYIDCDLGEAYKIQSDKYMTLNKYIDLGSKLPTLAVGSTEITFDNTITDFKIVPRWWKV